MITFKYKNHRGVVDDRLVHPIALEYLTNPGYGYSAGWFLRCKDYSHGRNGDERSFLLANIQIDVMNKFPHTLPIDWD